MTYRGLYNLDFASLSDFISYHPLPCSLWPGHISWYFPNTPSFFLVFLICSSLCLECPQIFSCLLPAHHSGLCTNIISSEKPFLTVLYKRYPIYTSTAVPSVYILSSSYSSRLTLCIFLLSVSSTRMLTSLRLCPLF